MSTGPTNIPTRDAPYITPATLAQASPPPFPTSRYRGGEYGAVECYDADEVDALIDWERQRANAAEKELASWKAVAHDHSERLKVITAERDRLNALINTPHTHDFLEAVKLEMPHQRERWGAAHDAGKTPADWFWLVGYLAGKALHALVSGNIEKAKHHVITTAAALGNWFLAITGESTSMRPGIDPPARGES